MATNGVRESIRDLKAGPKAAEAKAHAQLHALGTVAAAASGDVGAQAQIGMAAANVWNNASTTDKASMATQGVLTAASMFAPVGLESSLARGTATATETLTASTDLFVIGRQADTAAYVGQSGFNVLNVPSAAWTPELNAAWVQSGIDGGNNFLLASPLTGPNLFSEEFGQTMFATELDQLNAATYTQVGNTMVAPGSANVPH
jgi:hypothetical protein